VLEHEASQLAEDYGADLFGRHGLVADAHGGALAHAALDALDGAGITPAAGACGATDEQRRRRGIPTHRGGHGLAAVLVGVDEQIALGGIEDRDLGVRGSEIDAYRAVYEHVGAPIAWWCVN